MKIELKNVHYSERLSEDTYAFVADVWVDGKKAGTATNRGTGGDTDVEPRELKQKLTEYGKTLGKFDLGHGLKCDQDVEFLVDQAFEDWRARRDLKKLMKKRVVFTKTTEPGIFSLSIYGVAVETSARSVSENPDLVLKHHIRQVLNLLPFEEALALYRCDVR